MQKSSTLFHLIFVLSCVVSLSLGCTKKEYDSSKGAKKDNQIVKTSSTPNALDTLSYRFIKRETCEGYCNSFTKIERCDTIQSFKTKEDFCAGLQNAKLNNQCAKEERADLYLRYCGDTFVEEGVAGFANQLEDVRVGSCAYEIPESNGVDYCNNLKDEAQHNYCGWEERRIQFAKYNCEGEFSALAEEYRSFTAPATDVTQQYTTITESADRVYEVYNQVFRFGSSTTARTVFFTNIQLIEDNCEVMGQARFGGTINTVYISKDPDSGNVTMSPPTITNLNIFGGDPVLGADRSFEFNLQVLNPGKCQNLQFSYDMEVR